MSAEVSVDLWHTYLGDLTVTLTSPDRTSTTVFDPSGWSSGETFSDTLPVSSRTGNGVWTLSCVDNAEVDSGELYAWSVTLTCR